MSRASEPERRRLHEIFEGLCRIPSPSGDERACAEAVIAELQRGGVDVEEDDAAAALGGNCGNLFAVIPGREASSLLLCAHLDTVPPGAPLAPVVLDGCWENANEGILGADNKAAVAVMIVLAQRLAAQPARRGLELLLTVGEETALAGAKEWDAGRLRSDFGFVFDHASPIGEIVTAAPTYYRLRAELRGSAAHAGVRPQDGRNAILAAARAISAMRLGRIDAQTTANIGLIQGGSAGNVVAERCVVIGEARSLDRHTAHATVSEMVDRLHDGANDPECECDLDVSVECLFEGFRIAAGAPHVALAEAALRECGYRPQQIATGGGSDANALIAAGFPCLNLADGTQRNHQPDERLAVEDLEGMLEVALAIFERA